MLWKGSLNEQGRLTERMNQTTVDEIVWATHVGKSYMAGNLWKMKSKKNDFYLDFTGSGKSPIHISLHGPQRNFREHRFHVKAPASEVNNSRKEGSYVWHDLPTKGFSFSGVPINDHSTLVARIRTTWQLTRPRFIKSALSAPWPGQKLENQAKLFFDGPIPPNCFFDVDIAVSYGEPYWPTFFAPERFNAKLGPLRNHAGMWLTGTAYRRNEMEYPSPVGLNPPLPSWNEKPSRITALGPGEGKEVEMMYFIESITSEEYVRGIVG